MSHMKTRLSITHVNIMRTLPLSSLVVTKQEEYQGLEVAREDVGSAAR